jgi:DNA polymerase|nr:MAG TPA: DNA POLYMERASE [Caudoviricetes sp.]
MNILTIDFETYYDSDYSLRKMTTIEYIMSGKFQAIMMSYALNDEPIKNALGYAEIKAVLDSIDWNNTVLNAQNTQFDATIVQARFGHTAKFYTDTMAMARVTGAHVFKGASLAAIAEVLQSNGVKVPPKGEEVASACGLHLYCSRHGIYYLSREEQEDPNKIHEGHTLLQNYIRYCNNDVHLAREAFKYFTKFITPEEMKYGDMILKCYIEPSLYLDLGIIEQEIARIHKRDEERAREVADKYFAGDQKLLRSTCRSVPKFTAFLRDLGGVFEDEIDEEEEIMPYQFIIPTKYSDKKGRIEPCYAKTYPPVIELCDRMDEIGEVFRTKLALNSSIELSRAERFKSIAQLNCGFGMPYTISGAHTHRLGGSGGLNVQNLSSGRKVGQSNALKRSITAPLGHQVVVFDSSQIELRTGSYIAGDKATLRMFVEGRDPYSEQAALIYGGDPFEIKRMAKSGVEPYASIQRPAGKASLLSNIYGTGAIGFMNYAKLMGVDMSHEEAAHIVKVYRDTHPEVVNAWNDCELALRGMLAGASGYFGGPDGKLFYYDGSRVNHGVRMPGIRLPDGNWLNYSYLTKREKVYPDGTAKMNYAYRGLKEGRIQWIFTYAARIFENCNQALAFAVMKYQAMLINQRYRIVLNTHDEWGIVVPDAEVPQAKEYMQWCMRQVPTWATGLPVDCEGDSAIHYGDCK